MRRLTLSLLALMLVSGCAIGSNQMRPAVAGADGAWVTAVAPGVVDETWWKALGDETLNSLVADALAHNLDLKQAEARLREARSGVDAARGGRTPQIRATGSAVEQQVSANGQLPVRNIPGFERQYPLFDAGLDASWEIDLWGGTAKSIEAAGARATAASLRAQDTRLRIIAEVVRFYGELRSAQGRQNLLGQEADLRSEIQRLFELRFRAGESSRSDVAEARQRTLNARAQLAAPKSDAATAAYALAVLTGRPPEGMTSLVQNPARLPDPPALVASGIRSELLQRRPDVRAAEADLQAAIADVAVNKVNLYPRFSLIGSAGLQARSVGDLPSGDSTRFSVGPSFSWPIFSLGRIRAQIGAANARAEAGAAAYEKAVLQALADSESAANRYANTTETRTIREQALAEARVSADLAALRFRKGEDNRIQMLEAQSAQMQAEQALLAARIQGTIDWLAFSKALGGGGTKPK